MTTTSALSLARHTGAAVLVVAMVALSGCATTAMTPEQQTSQLASQRWGYLIDGQWQKAYDMLTPAYRSLHDLREYQSQFKGAVQWKRAEVASTTCEAEKCEVRIELTVASPFGRGKGDTISTFFTETWLNEGGRWYYYEKP
ncbi:hypothetical protein C8C95_2634 [Acidovorax sp. 99]|uniref:hypothetical protein n=1 Tax=Acidovorax sp. 99 TaxID=2135634 RepID=UPI000D5F21FD|nr:hypothetical protein [Acidovorax sp. 99]PVY91776.1 hypothetical protein C8C95_2634 [Acidovorax sp. 99]